MKRNSAGKAGRFKRILGTDVRTQKYVFQSTKCGFTGEHFKAAPTPFGSLTLGLSPVPPEVCQLCSSTPRPALAAEHSLCRNKKHSAVSKPIRSLIVKPQGADPFARGGRAAPCGPRHRSRDREHSRPRRLLLSLVPGPILVFGRFRTARPPHARPRREVQKR